MSVLEDQCRRVLAAASERTRHIVEALGTLDVGTLMAPSELPDWSRLTIACHLRYGAEALLRMTDAALAARPVAYYPDGHERQRPRTLAPLPGELPLAVVVSLADRSEELDHVWASLVEEAWSLAVVEPDDCPDLGPVELARLPLLRLTEVEVHGSDLGLGLDEWSDLFVDVALPMRLDWLNVRRANHRAFDARLEGSWLLVASDGPVYKVTVRGVRVESHPADANTPARAVVEATSRDLLALLLGRSLTEPPRLTGDVEFGRAFPSAFPGP